MHNPEMLVGVNGKNGARPRRMYMGQGYAFLRAQFERRPYNLFNLPSHLKGESVIGITGAGDPDERSDTDATMR